MLKQKYFLTDIFILSAEKQPIKSSWREIEWLPQYDILYCSKSTTNGTSSTISHKYFLRLFLYQNFQALERKQDSTIEFIMITIHIYITRVVWNILQHRRSIYYSIYYRANLIPILSQKTSFLRQNQSIWNWNNDWIDSTIKSA